MTGFIELEYYCGSVLSFWRSVVDRRYWCLTLSGVDLYDLDLCPAVKALSGKFAVTDDFGFLVVVPR